MKADTKKQNEAALAWLADQKVLIADSNASSRAGVAKILSQYGVKGTNLQMADSYALAVEQIQAHKPGVLITDFDLGKGAGLNLLQEQRLSNPAAKDSLFVIVTGNTSQSAVAQAAEEDVDTFILKPYTIEIFRNCLIQAIIGKITPNEYLKTIQAGKDLLMTGKPDEAVKLFEKAKTLNSKPALACFYAGQAELMKKLLDKAEGDYKQGLSYNKIHYKCMVGLFDALMDRKSYTEAYEVMKKMSLYFPANPKRLTTIIRLAVMTNKVEDMEKYHLIFTSLDSRSPELVKYICAGLVVCGKYYLKTGSQSRGLDLFQKAAVSSAGGPKFLREIIFALCAHKCYKEADAYLKRFQPDARTSGDYFASDLIVVSKLLAADETVNRGRAMLKAGAADPSIHEILIEASIKANQIKAAEELGAEAKRKWPKLAAQFDQALKTERPEPPKDAAKPSAEAA